MSRRTNILAVFLGLALAAAPVSLAAKGGGKNAPAPSATCVAAGGVVQATGLPTDQVVNFLVTDATGTTGWVLGFTPDGTWSVNVKAPTGPTTYQFVSRIFRADGSKYTVFAGCSA
jgi:hypothetical protein